MQPIDSSTGLSLSPAQAAALGHVRMAAIRERTRASCRASVVLDTSSVACDAAALSRLVAANTRLALNFHPDRLAVDGRTVAEALLADGVYRSQFESGISNGGLSAFPGGDRDRWEEQSFGGAYQRLRAAPHERPKYGGLNVMNYADGPCPRFGSCHLRLRPAVLARATFCFGDSHTAPTDVGTIDAFDSVLAGLLEATKATGMAFGRAQSTIESLVAIIEGTASASDDVVAVQGRALDDYIEAQVHGSIELAIDADAIVADPSFRGTAIGHELGGIARRYDLELTWHVGFELDVADVGEEFRGPAIPTIARHIARTFGGGAPRLDAEIIGRAARAVVNTPSSWLDFGTPAQVLQYIKQLWHVLVRYGAARDLQSS
jgi:hypothetical protein